MNYEPFRVFNLSRISFLKPDFGKIFQRKATLFFSKLFLNQDFDFCLWTAGLVYRQLL